MWRLLIVLALCGASLVQGEERAASCNNVTFLQNVTLTELQGIWVARKVVTQLRKVREEKVCFEKEIVDVSDNNLTMIIKVYVTPKNGDKQVTTQRMAINVVEGKWIDQYQGHEMFIFSADPTNYLLVVLCDTERARHQISQLVVYVRRQSSDGSGNISEEDLAKKLDDAVNTLGLQNYNQIEFNYSECPVQIQEEGPPSNFRFLS